MLPVLDTVEEIVLVAEELPEVDAVLVCEVVTIGSTDVYLTTAAAKS